LVAVTLAAGPVWGQDKAGNIVRVFETRTKAGSSSQYEEGRKRHFEYHKKAGDTWTWNTWQVETGDRAGTYFTASGGHNWKDFDAWDQKYGTGDDADGARNLAPYSDGGGNAFYAYLPDVSRPLPGNTPSPMSQIIWFQLNMWGEQDFMNQIKKIHEAIGKTNWPANYYWYMLVDGGEGPTFALALPLKGWADMQEPEVSFPMMLEKAYGRTEAASILDRLNQIIRKQRTETWRYRPDLSYAPSNP
jgi:hypothetical protein